MPKFAKDTEVSVAKSQSEIEVLITKYGATATAFMNGQDSSIVAFEANGRRIMFTLPLPSKLDKRFTHVLRGRSSTPTPRAPDKALEAWEQACRQRWRALALVIKAKLEAVESGITTFEDEFLAHIVMPDGQTVGSHIRPGIALAYDSGNMVPLLPPPSRPQ
jgi:hypothetical protein